MNHYLNIHILYDIELYKSNLSTDPKLTRTWLDENNIVHREFGPAVMSYYPNGNKEWIWYHHGEKHRLMSPAFMHSYNNGSINYRWYEYNKLTKFHWVTDVTIEKIFE
jgi:hypothetical protein